MLSTGVESSVLPLPEGVAVQRTFPLAEAYYLLHLLADVHPYTARHSFIRIPNIIPHTTFLFRSFQINL